MARDWQWFSVQPTSDEIVTIGELVFLPGGSVVIANTAHVDGQPINQTFGTWKATREAGFRQTLVIVDGSGDKHYFAFLSNNRWWRAVRFQHSPEMGVAHAIKREVAHRGVTGAIAYWIECAITIAVTSVVMGLLYGPIVWIVFWILYGLLDLLLSTFM